MDGDRRTGAGGVISTASCQDEEEKEEEEEEENKKNKEKMKAKKRTRKDIRRTGFTFSK